jgi:hypothetical protein
MHALQRTANNSLVWLGQWTLTCCFLVTGLLKSCLPAAELQDQLGLALELVAALASEEGRGEDPVEVEQVRLRVEGARARHQARLASRSDLPSPAPELQGRLASRRAAMLQAGWPRAA